MNIHSFDAGQATKINYVINIPQCCRADRSYPQELRWASWKHHTETQENCK